MYCDIRRREDFEIVLAIVQGLTSATGGEGGAGGGMGWWETLFVPQGCARLLLSLARYIYHLRWFGLGERQLTTCTFATD
jgi:hypothetical protein